MRRKKQIWNVRTFDVWGNQKDGYEVNNCFSAGTVELPENPSDLEIKRALVQIGILKNTRFHLTMDGDDQYIHIEHESTGYPICALDLDTLPCEID